MKNSLLILAITLTLSQSVLCQNIQKKVLFLGNSYTSRNDLPFIISNIANSRGDVLLFDSHAPSSHTLLLHTRDATTLSKIASGNWDFVVLQEQSQRPALALSEVETRFFPPIKSLDSLINLSSPVGETLLYMTWGRKTGDSENCGAYPPVCTYEGMDNLLRQRYIVAAENNKAAISPVGALWRHIRKQYPNIELYNTDESHPSLAGSYAAALCFYACIFKKNPVLVNYNHGLTATEANNIKVAVKTVVLDSLQKWQLGTYDPKTDLMITSIVENQTLDILLYPNPVSNKLMLNFTHFDRLFVINALGQNQVPFYSKNGENTIIDFSNFKEGQYFLVIEKDGRVLSRKVVKW